MSIVVAGTSCGIPEPIATWRTRVLPSPAFSAAGQRLVHFLGGDLDLFECGADGVRAKFRGRVILELPAGLVDRRPHGSTCVMLGARQTIRASSPAGSWTVPAASASLDGGLGLVAACIDLRYMLSALVRFHAARPADESEAG